MALGRGRVVHPGRLDVERVARHVAHDRYRIVRRSDALAQETTEEVGDVGVRRHEEGELGDDVETVLEIADSKERTEEGELLVGEGWLCRGGFRSNGGGGHGGALGRRGLIRRSIVVHQCTSVGQRIVAADGAHKSRLLLAPHVLESLERCVVR